MSQSRKFVRLFLMFLTRSFRSIRNVIVCTVASAIHRLHLDRAYQMALASVNEGIALQHESQSAGVIVSAFEGHCDSSTEEEQDVYACIEAESRRRFVSHTLPRKRLKTTDNQVNKAEIEAESVKEEPQQAPGEDSSGPVRSQGKLTISALPTVRKAIEMLECKRHSPTSKGDDVKQESPVKEILNRKHAVKVKIYAIEAKMKEQPTFPPPPLQAERIREAYMTERATRTTKHLLPKSFDYVCQKRG